MAVFRVTTYLQLWGQHQSQLHWHVHCLPNWLWLLCWESPPSTGVSWLPWETSCRVRDARRELWDLGKPRKPSFTVSLPKRVSVNHRDGQGWRTEKKHRQQNISRDTRIWLFWVLAPSVLEQGLRVSLKDSFSYHWCVFLCICVWYVYMCGGLNKNGPHRLTFECWVTREWHYLRRIRTCGFAGASMSLRVGGLWGFTLAPVLTSLPLCHDGHGLNLTP